MRCPLGHHDVDGHEVVDDVVEEAARRFLCLVTEMHSR